MRGALTLALLGVALGVAAATPDNDQRLLDQIVAERASVNQRFEREQADCRQRFALNSCTEEARTRQRQALATLQARQREIDQRQRSQRAIERQARIDRKRAEVEARSTAAAPAAVEPAATEPRVAPAKRQASSAADKAAAQAKAAERAAAARKRQAEIKADQARIEARIAKRNQQGKQPLPLPPVPGASAP